MIEIATKKDLVDLLPRFFQDIQEYPEIMKAWAEGLRLIGGSSQQVWNNQYIQTCDEATIAQWEAYLKLNPSPSDSLEVRRFRVMAQLMLAAPFTERRIRSTLDDLLGAGTYTLTVDPVNSEVHMEFNSAAGNGALTFCTIMYEMAPAHIYFTVKENIVTDIDSDLNFGGCIEQLQYTNIS